MRVAPTQAGAMAVAPASRRLSRGRLAFELRVSFSNEVSY